MTTEERQAYNAAYWQANRERLKAVRAQWRLEKADQIRAYRSSDVVAERRRSRRLERIDIERQQRRVWAKANQPTRTRRDRKKANKTGAAIGRVDYKAIMQAWDRVCHICRRVVAEGEKTHFDHVIPLAKGGPHTQENILPAHAVCNLRKQDRIAI